MPTNDTRYEERAEDFAQLIESGTWARASRASRRGETAAPANRRAGIHGHQRRDDSEREQGWIQGRRLLIKRAVSDGKSTV